MNIKEELDLESISLEALAEKAGEIQRNRKDITVRDIARNMKLAENGTVTLKKEGAAKKTHNIEISDWAFGQLAAKAGVPADYAKKCMAKIPALGARNINAWLGEIDPGKKGKSADVLVRTYNGQIDGILSTGYARFDSDRLIDVLQDTLKGDYIVKGYYLSDERFHLRLVNPKMIDVPGEDLFPALFIDSSDVGRRAIDIHFGIWKKICTNGLCIQKLGGSIYHQRHIGVGADGIKSEIRKNLLTIPQITDACAEAIKKASQERIDPVNDFNRLYAQLKKELQVTEDQVNDILALAQERYDLSRWGITNGITEYAQRYGIDDRYHMEIAAGNFLLG